MKQSIIRARKEHKCRRCSIKGNGDIGNILPGEAYIQNMYMVKGKFIYTSFHGECWIRNLRERLRRKSKPRSRKVEQKDGKTKFHYRNSEDPVKVERRRRLLQYLNRDRWKLEGYYERQDEAEINRSYRKIAKRIEELSLLGLDFRMNELSELIIKNDKELAKRLYNSGDWTDRASILRTHNFNRES